MSRSKFIALIVCFALFFAVGAAQAQKPAPPTDLLFSALRKLHPAPGDALLVRVDTQSWTAISFYVDADLHIGRIRPLSWSPDGQSLAVLRSVILDPDDVLNHIVQVCVLSRIGELIQCMDATPRVTPNHHGESQIQSLTWSADSTKLYFVAADAEREILRFVEAEVTTGRTLRVLSEHGVGTQLVWSPELDYRVQVNREWEQTSGTERLSVEYQRLTPALQAAGRSELLGQFLASGYFDRLCPETSPRGTYFVAVGGLSWEDRFTLFNRHGAVRRTRSLSLIAGASQAHPILVCQGIDAISIRTSAFA